MQVRVFQVFLYHKHLRNFLYLLRGNQVAEFLGIPHVTGVNKIDWINENVLRVKSEIESGYMTIETQIPVVLAVEKSLKM